MRGAESVLPREIALTATFWAAALGVLVVTVAVWQGLGVGLRHRSVAATFEIKDQAMPQGGADLSKG